MTVKRVLYVAAKTAVLPLMLAYLACAALWDATRGLRGFLREWYE